MERKIPQGGSKHYLTPLLTWEEHRHRWKEYLGWVDKSLVVFCKVSLESIVIPSVGSSDFQSRPS